MELGELAFKDDDFGLPESPMLAAECNRILTKKLEKAQTLFGLAPHGEVWTNRDHMTATHMGFLVCIEEVKK
jgi:hypothetical protein